MRFRPTIFRTTCRYSVAARIKATEVQRLWRGNAIINGSNAAPLPSGLKLMLRVRPAPAIERCATAFDLTSNMTMLDVLLGPAGDYDPRLSTVSSSAVSVGRYRRKIAWRCFVFHVGLLVAIATPVVATAGVVAECSAAPATDELRGLDARVSQRRLVRPLGNSRPADIREPVVRAMSDGASRRTQSMAALGALIRGGSPPPLRGPPAAPSR